MKHRLKVWMREAWARLLAHTGLWVLVDRAMPRRLTILFGHCVADPDVNGFLPPDMRIPSERLERILRRLGRRFELCTIGEGHRRLREPGRRSLVALSMDDGYLDNRTRLLPLLERTGARATVFLESRPLDERRVNWSHKLFWLLAEGARPEELARAYRERCRDEATAARLDALLAAADGETTAYAFKRILKYDADEADRDRVLDELFRERGGDEQALCDRLYLSWDDARALHAAGVELGGHTVAHEILSRLPPDRQHAEIAGCAASMERALGSPPKVFAYPFGRSWDYDATSLAATRDAGFEVAVNTHAGTNDPTTDPLQLKRLALHEHVREHLLVAEACGGFDLLRRVGLDLSE